MDSTSAQSLRGRVGRSIFWLTWSRVVVQVLSFATTVLVARILVPADYGVMALATVFIGTAGMLAEMGLGRAIIQFRDLERPELDTCFWLTLTLAIGAYALLALGASLIAGWLAVPRLAEVVPVLALVLPLTASTVVSDSLLRKQLSLDRISQAEIIGGLISLPVTFGCAVGGLGVWALVAGWLVNSAGRSLAIFCFAPWRPSLHVGGPRAREMLRFSLTTLAVNMLWSLKEHADVLAVGKFSGQANVGLYSMAKDLALIPASKFSTLVNMLSSPLMAELQTDVDAMRAALYRGLRLTVLIVMPTAAGLALEANDIVVVLLGPNWLPAAPVMQLFFVYTLVRAVDALVPPILFARHRERFLFWYCLTLFVCVPAAAALGAAWGGASGAVVLLTTTYCGLVIVMTKEALVELKGRFSDLWSQTWPIVAATLAMAAVVILLKEFLAAGLGKPTIIRLVVISAIGAATYGTVLLAIGKDLIRDSAEVVGWILLRKRVDA